MARIFCTTFMFIVLLVAFLAVSDARKTCKGANDMCGGIAGFQCCDGLDCILEGTYPDASGKCTPKTPVSCAGKMCGGFAGIPCCDGFDCEIKDKQVADASGVCKKRQSCQRVGQHCGGFTRIPYVCCKGLKCVLTNPQIADIGGTCKRMY